MCLQRIGQVGICLYFCLGLVFASGALAKTTIDDGQQQMADPVRLCEKLYQKPSSRAFDACRLAIKKQSLSEQNWQRWGQLHFRAGIYGKAQRYFSKALGLARNFGNDRAVALALNGLGRTHKAKGAFKKARDLFRQSLAVCHDDKKCRAGNHDGLGYIALKQRQYKKAAKSFELCLENANNNRLRASCNYGLATVHFQKDDISKARQLCAESLSLYERADNKRGMAAALGCLASAAKSAHASKKQWCAYKVRRARLYRELGELKKSIILQRGIAHSNCSAVQ
jgi:uncharacterized protein HemY